MHVTLQQLRAFVAVLETGSFSEAAKAMHLSQAALSGLVKELESRVGVRLLDRNTRHVSASGVGGEFAPLVRRVLANLDEALDSLANLKALRGGTVRVAAPEPLSCTVLPGLIARYTEQYPQVDVRFEDVPIEQVLSGLANGSCDIGFGPAGALLDDALQAQALWSDPLWVALRPDDPLAGRRAVRWLDLAGHSLINYMPNLAANVLAQVPTRRHPRNIVPVHRVNTALALLRVRAGAAICPASAESLVRGFGLAFLPLEQPVVRWRVALFERRGTALSPASESFAAFIRECARAHPERAV
ncbi:LysR family transcriptional regulator [Verticiella sediminum]|uniref:LysR family transcriptional regulator n=1 Tax=Verticiella sediminum TaxID=1247510 RepID=A0A556A7B3_9BURK|nr:LysR family transcriptional regulator [Verticiella sediminum]TSH88769.1 LysR family transcriptional regulator [Verticiella sediminum]